MFSTDKSDLDQVDERHQWSNRTNVAVAQESGVVAKQLCYRSTQSSYCQTQQDDSVVSLPTCWKWRSEAINSLGPSGGDETEKTARTGERSGVRAGGFRSR